MSIATRIIPNTYRDSVSLMQISSRLAEMPGVDEASMIMATAGNLDLLREVGLLERPLEARPSDVLVVVRAKSAALANAALDRAAAALTEQAPSGSSMGMVGGAPPSTPRSLAMALREAPGAPVAQLALISVPGEYAAAEARKALDAGLNVMLFSDNVSLDDEIALKRRARAKKLLMMGPDCGTAIINGVPLGFANAVRRGPIGCIAASGTGLQQVTSLVDRMGSGISQAIGIGGRDLSSEVGGLSMIAALRALARDRDTQVIVLISKPPAPNVTARMLAEAAKAKKPMVVNFIGADATIVREAGLHAALTLEDAARTAVALAAGKAVPRRSRSATAPKLAKLPRFAPEQRYVRGLYSGGTFCYEASLLLGAALGRVWSNASASDEGVLDDPWKSREHSVIDLGDDLFTRGRPHPMIDHRLRNERLLREAADPAVAVILFDVVLGYGAHPDPAAAMLPALRAAQAVATRAKRRISFVASVCGTERDPQDLARQEAALVKAGVLLGHSNAEAVRMAIALAQHAAKGGDRRKSGSKK